MFSRNRNSDGPRERSAAPTLISADLRIDGDVTSDGEIQIDGVVNGDIKCEKLSIGTSGRIKGAVTAERTLVRGHVAGQINSRVVVLSSTAQVSGDVLHETLTIEAGARLEGHCRRMDTVTQSESNINLVVGDTARTSSSSV